MYLSPSVLLEPISPVVFESILLKLVSSCVKETAFLEKQDDTFLHLQVVFQFLQEVPLALNLIV
jgi:hypothetical protein